MDFANFKLTEKSDEGAWCHLNHPVTKEPLYLDDAHGCPDHSKPCRIKMAGRDSAVWKEAEKQFVQRQLDKAQAGNSAKVTVESVQHNALAVLASATLEWENIPYNGNILRLDTDKHNARALYAAVAWIKEQVDEFAGNRANYLTGAEATDETFDPVAYLSSVTGNSETGQSATSDLSE